MTSLRPWRDEYQLLCSIDSVSGEMKMISPFIVPRCVENVDHHTCTAIESHHKVINSVSDFEESKAFRAKLCGNMASMWRCDVSGSVSALDKAKVNSHDMFAYYNLMFTKSRAVVQNHKLTQLRLTNEATDALRKGTFKDVYGDMIVVGYVCGGEAEAVMKVTKFSREKKSSLQSALRLTLMGGEAEVDESETLKNELKDTTTTIYSRRTGVTSHSQLENSNDFRKLVHQLTKAAQNEGAKIYALCYRVELFTQITMHKNNVLNREVVDEMVTVLQKQFTLVQYVLNTCEWYLDPNREGEPLSPIFRKEAMLLRSKALEAVKVFDRLKGYREVMSLKRGDPVLAMGYELQSLMSDLEEKHNVDKVKDQALALRGVSESSLSSGGSTSSSGGGALSPGRSPGAWQAGLLLCHIRSGRNFQRYTISLANKFMPIDPYAVVKLGKFNMTSPTLNPITTGGQFNFDYTFRVPMTQQQLAEQEDLVFEVYDQRSLSKDPYLGCIQVPLQTAYSLGTRASERTAQLQRRREAESPVGQRRLSLLPEDLGQLEDEVERIWYPVEKRDSTKYKCRGELQIEFTFKPVSITNSSAPSAQPAEEETCCASDDSGSDLLLGRAARISSAVPALLPVLLQPLPSFSNHDNPWGEARVEAPDVSAGPSKEERARYEQLWEMSNSAGGELMLTEDAKVALEASGLPREVLYKVWQVSIAESCDPKLMDLTAFVKAMHLIAQAKRGVDIFQLPVPPKIPKSPGKKFSADCSSTLVADCSGTLVADCSGTLVADCSGTLVADCSGVSVAAPAVGIPFITCEVGTPVVEEQVRRAIEAAASSHTAMAADTRQQASGSASRQQMTGSTQQAMGSTQQMTGSTQQAMGSAQQVTGSTQQVTGSTQQAKGSTQQGVAPIKRKAGASRRVIGVLLWTAGGVAACAGAVVGVGELVRLRRDAEPGAAAAKMGLVQRARVDAAAAGDATARLVTRGLRGAREGAGPAWAHIKSGSGTAARLAGQHGRTAARATWHAGKTAAGEALRGLRTAVAVVLRRNDKEKSGQE